MIMAGKRENRPQSHDIVDLHVFLTPLELWIAKYRTAFNNAVLHSTSAGFIRVPGEQTLSHVRQSILDQLGRDIIPEEFVFLRSVGRCLAAVNQQQEQKLKAKHFLPPVAFSPELFLLPCTHNDLMSILTRQSNNVYFEGEALPESATYGKDGSFYMDSLQDNDSSDSKGTSLGSGSTGRDTMKEQNETWNQSEHQYEPGENFGMIEYGTNVRQETNEEREHKPYEEITPVFQPTVSDESEMLYQVPSPTKHNSTLSEKLRKYSVPVRNKSAMPVIQVKEASLPPSPQKPENIGRQVLPSLARPLPSATERDTDATPPLVHEKEVETNDVIKEALAAGNSQAINHLDARKTPDFPDKTLNFGQEDPHSDYEEDLTKNAKPEENEILFTNRSSLEEVKSGTSPSELKISPRERSRSSRERRLKAEVERKRLEEKKKNAAEGVNKMMQEMDDLLRKKKLEEEKRKKQEEEVKKMMLAVEEEKKAEIDRLKEESRLAKEEKAEVQRRRETIVKLAKELQAKITVKTTKDTNMWKKKYQAETERTTELEEELNRLRTDLDIQHRKLLGTLDGKPYQSSNKNPRAVKSKAPSQLSNQKIQLQRLQQDVDALKQRVDETRVKLSAERKMRAIAFQELKEIRNQALEKKINAALSSRRFPGSRTVNGNVTA